jgi:hypothetical protein
MGGMQTPEKPDFMRQEMVDKMSELPNYISVNEPIPGKRGLKDSISRKQAYTYSHHSKSNNSAYKCIQDIGKERNFVMNYLEPFIKCSSYDF